MLNNRRHILDRHSNVTLVLTQCFKNITCTHPVLQEQLILLSFEHLRSRWSTESPGRDTEPDATWPSPGLLECNYPWWNHWKPHLQVPRVESTHSSDGRVGASRCTVPTFKRGEPVHTLPRWHPCKSQPAKSKSRLHWLAQKSVRDRMDKRSMLTNLCTVSQCIFLKGAEWCTVWKTCP